MSPRPRFGPLVPVACAILVLLMGAVSLGLPAARAATSPVTGMIRGPAFVGVSLQATYIVNATGGPAVAANGTQVGTFTYRANLSGPNVVGAGISPSSGVLVNGQTTLTFTAPNATETLTLTVGITSGYKGTNASTNVTQSIQIVTPYTLHATLAVGSVAVTSFNLTVTLDGSPVGSVVIPTLQKGATYPVVFHYVTGGLSTGYHTFGLSLTQEHGLVAFSDGSETFTTTFYVTPPAPNYTVVVIVGVAAFVGAVFIWSAVVGARRRGRRAR